MPKLTFLIAIAFATFVWTAIPARSQTPPFTQAPPVGLDTSAGMLLLIDQAGNLEVEFDPSQGPYDGTDDTLVGVQNNSPMTLQSLSLASASNIFGFDGDGINTVNPHPLGAPFGPTGYEGPGVSFTNINSSGTSGTVNFAGGISPGGSAYFALENAISISSPPITGSPTLTVTPPPAVPEPSALALSIIGLSVGTALVRPCRRKTKF